MTDYARGYLAGYNAVLNPTDQQPEVSKPLEWLVCLDPQWGLYQVWVGDRCLGHGATYQEAERKAQAYIGNGETIKRQNAAVMASYAAKRHGNIFTFWTWRAVATDEVNVAALLFPRRKT